MEKTISVLAVIVGIELCLGQRLLSQPDAPDGKICRMEDILKCMNDAVVSYVRNTEGEEAAKLPPSPAAAQKVSGAVSADVRSPSFNANATCAILKHTDVVGFGNCMEALSTKCDMSSDRAILEQQGIEAIPPLRIGGFDMAKNVNSLFCSTVCVTLDISGMFAKIKGYWKLASYALNPYEDGESKWTASSQQCADIKNYFTEQWTIAKHCPMLKQLTITYHMQNQELIEMCEINLPAEALTLIEVVKNAGDGSIQKKTFKSILTGILSILCITYMY